MPAQSLFSRRIIWLYVLVGLILLATVAVTLWWLGPLPPRVVVMTTGTAGSDYELAAQEYRTFLKRSGIELKLMPSAGAIENLARLKDKKSRVAAGFAEGGLTSNAQSPELESLGTVFYQPFWLFIRGEGSTLDSLRGKKVSIGPVGGGGRQLSEKLLALNGISENFATLLPLTSAAAGDALLRGEIDAATMLLSWDTDIVHRLVASPDVTVVSFPRADAYRALFPYLNKLTLPMGVADLANNRPPSDVTLLAPKASLIVRSDLHPAIQYLLLEAAQEAHGAPGIFNAAGAFPAAEPGDLPLSKAAREFYKSGPPFLQRYLPFWLAILARNLLVLLVPVLAVLYPLARLSPALFAWSMQLRILRLYSELRLIDSELASGAAPIDEISARLSRLAKRADHVRLPVSFASSLYDVRRNIEFVRARARAIQHKPEAPQTPKP
jgi:TRAP-type uncharacterized transport system substrate-binding protein